MVRIEPLPWLSPSLDAAPKMETHFSISDVSNMMINWEAHDPSLLLA